MRPRESIVRCIAAAAIVAGLFAGSLPGTSTVDAAPDDAWLDVVNAYRSMSGLPPVAENAGWSTDAAAHSCYMLHNGISHDEVPGQPGYTSGGDVAGNSGNVAVSSSPTATARDHIELWMTGPFHAIGILRPKLATTGFGMCADESTSPWRSGATLDVLRGVDDSRPDPTTATVFPGRDATVALDHFVTESPNPVTLCGWTGGAGLPLIALMPAAVGTAGATLVGPDGPVETCVLHGGNTASSGTAQAILGSANAVVVVPRQPLAPGSYTSTVTTSAGDVTWSFTIDPDAELPDPTLDLPDTAPVNERSTFEPIEPYRYADSRENRRVVRLRAGVPATVVIGAPDVTAVSANFTVDRPAASGFLTVYNCSAAVPVVSTLNFTGGAVPNQAFVPLSNGELCVYSPVDTDIIIDINGFFRAGAGATAGFVPLAPRRLHDTRRPELAALEPGVVRAIRVAGVAGGAPAAASAVAVNLTIVGPGGNGFAQAYPCDQNHRPEVSNVNFRPLEDRANSAIIPTAADGTICVVSNAAGDLLVDIAGYFVSGGGYQFTPLAPVRLLDTRSAFAELNPSTGGMALAAGQTVRLSVAGSRGVPANAKAVSVNLTAAEAREAGFVSAYPCGNRPDVSNLNTNPATPAIANGALVPLDQAGDLCLYASSAVHLIVDINGVWS
ncbi:MAG: CAP domain-containing protein [Ilumatobacteraceae bacterium]